MRLAVIVTVLSAVLIAGMLSASLLDSSLGAWAAGGAVIALIALAYVRDLGPSERRAARLDALAFRPLGREVVEGA